MFFLSVQCLKKNHGGILPFRCCWSTVNLNIFVILGMRKKGLAGTINFFMRFVVKQGIHSAN